MCSYKIMKGGIMLENFKLDQNSITSGYSPREGNLFTIISLLHINGFINNDSINALFKSLKAGKLMRNVNTYYSKINKEWYGDENIFEVYNDIFNSMINPKNAKAKLRLERVNKMRKINGLEPKIYKTFLTFEDSIKYLNLYLNRNRNYCIDHLFYEYILPAVKNFEYDKFTLNKMFEYEFPEVKSSSYFDDDYCCEYCCGDYHTWSRNRNRRNEEENNKETVEDILKLISKFLNTKRTKFKGSYKEYGLR